MNDIEIVTLVGLLVLLVVGLVLMFSPIKSGEELADVLFVVLCLANQTGIDLQKSFDKKLDLKTKRDHDRHHNNEKLKP